MLLGSQDLAPRVRSRDQQSLSLRGPFASYSCKAARNHPHAACQQNPRTEAQVSRGGSTCPRDAQVAFKIVSREERDFRPLPPDINRVVNRRRNYARRLRIDLEDVRSRPFERDAQPPLQRINTSQPLSRKTVSRSQRLWASLASRQRFFEAIRATPAARTLALLSVIHLCPDSARKTK